MERTRVKIISITMEKMYGRAMGSARLPYCVVECENESYVCWNYYDYLVKYIGKWVICYKSNFPIKKTVKPRHIFLTSIANISFGSAMEHFLLRRGF